MRNAALAADLREIDDPTDVARENLNELLKRAMNM